MGLPEQMALQGIMSTHHGGLCQNDFHGGCCTAACSHPNVWLLPATVVPVCGCWLLPAELGPVMQAADELRQYMTEKVLQKGDLLFSQVTCTFLPCKLKLLGHRLQRCPGPDWL